jgi:hypothetical protein
MPPTVSGERQRPSAGGTRQTSAGWVRKDGENEEARNVVGSHQDGR